MDLKTKIEKTSTYQEESVYFLLDTETLGYYDILKLFSNDLDNFKGKFIPRLTKAGTKCLVQIKVDIDNYTFSIIGKVAEQIPGVIGFGDETWAYNQTRKTIEWTYVGYNPWQLHRDFCTGKISEEEYKQKIEAGITALG